MASPQAVGGDHSEGGDPAQERSDRERSRSPVGTPPPPARRPLAEAGGSSRGRVSESRQEKSDPPVSSKSSPSKGGRGPPKQNMKQGPSNTPKGKSNIKPIHFKR